MDGHEGKRALVRPALADPVGGARKAAGTEGFGVDVFDLGVMRRLFRQVRDVGDVHGLSVSAASYGVPQWRGIAVQRLLKRGRPFVVG